MVGKKNFFEELAAGMENGYRQQDEILKKDTVPFIDKVTDGAVEGVAQVFSPFQWLKKLF